MLFWPAGDEAGIKLKEKPIGLLSGTIFDSSGNRLEPFAYLLMQTYHRSMSVTGPRSPKLCQPNNQFLRCLRMVCDTIFAAGAIVFVFLP